MLGERLSEGLVERLQLQFDKTAEGSDVAGKCAGCRCGQAAEAGDVSRAKGQFGESRLVQTDGCHPGARGNGERNGMRTQPLRELAEIA